MVRIGVEIEYLPGVEDPEALNIGKNLLILGYERVKKVSIRKTYLLDISGSMEEAEKIARDIAEKLLVNKIIQSYRIKMAGE